MLTTIFLSGCTCAGVVDIESLTVAGSNSVQPYAEVLAEQFSLQNPGSRVYVQGGGSSAGIMAAVSGTAEIGMSSRNLNASELERDFWVKEIARDGLAIIVHPDNPVENLTIEQVRDIYRGEITNWSMVGGLDRNIHVITREEGSGTRGAFEELVMVDARITPRAIVQSFNGAVRLLVSEDANAIGFISLGLVEQADQKPVRGLMLEGIAPTRDNVISGVYALFRPFLFVLEGEPEGIIKEFIDYVMSDAGQGLLEAEGLIRGVNIER